MSIDSSEWFECNCRTRPRFRAGKFGGTEYFVPFVIWTLCSADTCFDSPSARATALSNPETLMLPFGAKFPLWYRGIHPSLTTTLMYFQKGSLGGTSLILIFESGGSFGA